MNQEKYFPNNTINKKKYKKHSMSPFVSLDAGNVEHNIDMFNKMNGSGEISTGEITAMSEGFNEELDDDYVIKSVDGHNIYLIDGEYFVDGSDISFVSEDEAIKFLGEEINMNEEQKMYSIYSCKNDGQDNPCEFEIKQVEADNDEEVLRKAVSLVVTHGESDEDDFAVNDELDTFGYTKDADGMKEYLQGIELSYMEDNSPFIYGIRDPEGNTVLANHFDEYESVKNGETEIEENLPTFGFSDLINKLNSLDIQAIDEDLKYHDLRNMFEAVNGRLTPEEREEIKNVIQNTDDAEIISAALQSKLDNEDSTQKKEDFTQPHTIDDELTEETKPQYQVFLYGQNRRVKKPFATFDTEIEAEDFCNEHDWEYIDPETIFNWHMDYMEVYPKDTNKEIYGFSLNENVDLSNYMQMSSTLHDGGDTYAIFRSVEDGKGKWAAVKYEDGNLDKSKAFQITYNQARGLEPLSNIEKLGRKLGKKLLPRNESLTEKLVEAPQEVVDALIGILEENGFILDDEFKGNNPGKTWMGETHLQVINPDSYINDEEEESVQEQLKEYIPDELIEAIHDLDKESNCPITWNFGVNDQNKVTGGLDIMKQYVDDEEESLNEEWAKNLDEAKKPKYWNSIFATKVIDDYKRDKLTLNNIEKWETEYNNGIKPTKSLGTKEILKYYIDTKKDPRNESLNEESNEYVDMGTGLEYWYFTTHGVMPGSVPRGLEILDVIDKPEGTYFKTNKVITTKALNWYDIKEKMPNNLEEAKKDNYLSKKDIDYLKINKGKKLNKGKYSVEYNEYVDANTNKVLDGEFILYTSAGKYGKDRTVFKDGKELLNYIKRHYDLDEENLNEASYGGAYDIEDDIYFTKEDLVEFADAIIEKLENKWPEHTYNISDIGMEGSNVCYISISDDEYYEFEDIFKIDMRKIKLPSDLMKYVDYIADKFINKFGTEYEYEERINTKEESLKEADEDSYFTNLIDTNDIDLITEFIEEADIDTAYHLLDYKQLITELYNQYVNDYKKFPNSRSMDSLDQKYSRDHGRFYKKWKPVIDKCEQIIKSSSVTGYGKYDSFVLKILDMLKSMEYNFPYGWKHEVYESLKEDTVKTSDGKWTNKGDSGETHGTFKTKKAADAQRKAMFANGYKGESLNENGYEKVISDLESIEKFLNENKFYNYDVYNYDNYPMETSKIEFEVTGDWKHDHLLFKDLIQEWAENNNRKIFKIDNKEVGDGESDYYTAVYDVYITKDDDAFNTLTSISALFRESLKESYDGNFEEGSDGNYYRYIKSKMVYDSDGFTTDYTLYMKLEPMGDRFNVSFVTVFGDSDLYRPDDGYYDWEGDTIEEAMEWFDNYRGPGGDDFDESLSVLTENKVKRLNNREKQVYIDEIENCEDREDLEDIIHEIFFYDKALFAMLRHFPKDASFEELKKNKLDILKDSLLDENLNEASNSFTYKGYAIINDTSNEVGDWIVKDSYGKIKGTFSSDTDAYEFIDGITESLNESNSKQAHKNLRDSMLDIVNYYVEAGYDMPKGYIWYSWEDLKDGIEMGMDDDFETAESILSILLKEIKSIEAIPTLKEEDPEYEIFKDAVKDLKYNMNKYLEAEGYNDRID